MRTLSESSTLIELLQERTYLTAQLLCRPLTAHLAPPLAALHDEWLAAMATEVKLAEAVVRTEAAVQVVDEQLDLLLVEIVTAVRAATGGDRNAQLYVRLLGTQRPSEAKQPVLGEQLELMRSWQPVLREAGVPALEALAPRLEALVTQADRALLAKQQAEQALAEFSETGARRVLLDRLNALRLSTYDALVALAEEHLELPADFPEQFFPREARARTPTIESVATSIQRLEAQLAKQRALLTELVEKREASERARAAAELAALHAELAALEKEQTARFARIAEVHGRIAELSGD